MGYQFGISLNLRTVVNSWSYCSRGKWRIDCLNENSHRFYALKHIFKTFHEAYTICLRGQRIGSHIGSVSWNIQHILWLISSFKQRHVAEILIGFQGRLTSIYNFFDSQIFYEVLDIFPRLSYRLTLIYHVECGDGRQPRILVDNFWIPSSKMRTFSTPGFLT